MAGDHADGLKVRMIAAFCGVDTSFGSNMRDGFRPASKQSSACNIGNPEEEDQRKPGSAVPLVTAQSRNFLLPNPDPSLLVGCGRHTNSFNVVWHITVLHKAATVLQAKY